MSRHGWKGLEQVEISRYLDLLKFFLDQIDCIENVRVVKWNIMPIL